MAQKFFLLLKDWLDVGWSFNKNSLNRIKTDEKKLIKHILMPWQLILHVEDENLKQNIFNWILHFKCSEISTAAHS